MRPAEFPARKRNSGSGLGDTAHLKRMAIQLAAQLPEDPNEAKQVLEYVRVLIEEFLAADVQLGPNLSPVS